MQKLTHRTALEGKTIRGVFDSKAARDLVLVFEDDDWCVLTIENEMSDDEAVSIDFHGTSQYDQDIKNFLLPQNLLKARLLSQAQHDYLVEEDRKQRAANLRRHAEHLISQATQLEAAK